MSSLPASPNPPKRRVFGFSQRARGLLGSRLPAVYRRPAAPDSAAPPPGSPGTPADSLTTPAASQVPATSITAAPAAAKEAAVPGENTAAGPPAGTGGLSIPEPPAAPPPPAVPARIPYSEWKGPRPRLVGAAFVLIVAAGVISLWGGIQASRSPVAELPSIAAQLEKIGIGAGEYATALQVSTLASSVVLFGVYLLVAVLVREGRNWARIGASVLAAAGLAGAAAAGSASQGLAVLVAAAGLCLLYGGDCSRYFRPRRSQYLSMS